MNPSHDLQGLLKFVDHGDWKACFGLVFDNHYKEFLAANDLQLEDVANVLGARWASAIWGCVFEDFLTRDFDTADGNIVDAYLKRQRRFDKTDRAEPFIRALRHGVMSLYEIVDVVPDRSFTARDLIRGGGPLAVSEVNLTPSLKSGDRIAARVAEVKGVNELGGGVLPFSPTASALLFDLLREMTGNKDAPELPALPDKVLGNLAPVFTMAWLVDVFTQVRDAQKAQAQSIPPAAEAERK